VSSPMTCVPNWREFPLQWRIVVSLAEAGGWRYTDDLFLRVNGPWLVDAADRRAFRAAVVEPRPRSGGHAA